MRFSVYRTQDSADSEMSNGIGVDVLSGRSPTPKKIIVAPPN